MIIICSIQFNIGSHFNQYHEKGEKRLFEHNINLASQLKRGMMSWYGRT